MPSDQGHDLSPVFFKFGRVGNDVFDDEVCCHLFLLLPLTSSKDPGGCLKEANAVYRAEYHVAILAH